LNPLRTATRREASAETIGKLEPPPVLGVIVHIPKDGSIVRVKEGEGHHTIAWQFHPRSVHGRLKDPEGSRAKAATMARTIRRRSFIKA
jgi:hypothetical protein